MDIYIIYTGNRFNQVLIFDTYEKARNWAKSATRWSDEEIKRQIVKPTQFQNFYTVFSPF